MKMSKVYFIIITRTEEEYKRYLKDMKIPLGIKFDKEKNFTKNKKYCGKVYVVHRKPLNIKKDVLVNVLKSGNLVPNSIVKKWQTLEWGKEHYPELFL